MMRVWARLSASEPALGPCALVAVLACAAMFVLQGRVGINLQDEGFLWYGAIRTHAGELPLRDFRAYDPGRYFWCAGWMAVLGEGVVALRAAGWAFASLGVTAGLLVVSRSLAGVRRAGKASIADCCWLAAFGVLLVAWMWAPWKLYEYSLSMIVAWTAVRLLEAPSTRRRFVAGVVVGLTAFFGRNLGVYAGVAVLAVTSTACWKSGQPRVRSLVDIFAGTLLGYAPMLALVLFADGYSAAFAESISFYARQGALNASVPFPFPWRIDFAGRTPIAAVSSAVIGSLFLVVPLAYAVFLVRGASARGANFVRWTPAFALSCVGAAWFHHAATRSDFPHLTQSIHPFFLAVACLPLVVPARGELIARVSSWSALALATAFGSVPALSVVRRAAASAEDAYVATRVGSDELLLAPREATLVRTLLDAVRTHVGSDEELWVSAQFAGLYPVLGRRAPTWDTYPAWQADEPEQERMLRELERVRWALVDVRAVGGDPKMRLELSHPRVWRWLVESFERVPLPGVPDSIVLLRRKD
jgi:hypothetical protein